MNQGKGHQHQVKHFVVKPPEIIKLSGHGRT